MLLTLSSLSACADEVYTDAADTGVDYQLQGEYLGKAHPKGGDDSAVQAMGVQVIALGGNDFEAVLYQGGLPGEGWQGDLEPVRVQGKRQGNQAKAVFQGDGYDLTIEEKSLTGQLPEDLKLEAGKVVRESPTLGEAPPEGAIVLFDGKNTDAWKKGAIDDRGLLATHLDGKHDFETKREDFRGVRVHLEFMTPFKPEARGQGRGNSGIFLPGAWEVQILDSFGLSGEHNECGGLYKEKAPDINMAYPPLTWQTYDVEYRAGKQESPDGEVQEPTRITVLHNGVMIHDNVELEPIRPGRAQKVEGPLKLQDHNNPVFFRNIWVEEITE